MSQSECPICKESVHRSPDLSGTGLVRVRLRARAVRNRAREIRAMRRTCLSLCLMMALACVSSSGCNGGVPETSEAGQDEVIFTGTVEEVEILGRREATVYLTDDVELEFLLVVNVDAVEGDMSSPIVAGENINLAIHSPGRLLGVNPTGRRFRFTAEWRLEPYKHFSWTGPAIAISAEE